MQRLQEAREAMCGRYTLTADLQALQERFSFQAEDLPWPARYNIAPTQDVLAVTFLGRNQAEPMRWGLVPFWAKDLSSGNRMINARSETVAQNRVFQRLLQRRRCLVLADGFYEWRKEGKRRIPFYVTLRGREPYAFAGLWDAWRSPTGEHLKSCTILTTTANALMRPIHDRMPVILPPEAERLWLDPLNEDPAVVTSLLLPFPAEAMECYPVSDLVNSVRSDAPECILPREGWQGASARLV